MFVSDLVVRTWKAGGGGLGKRENWIEVKVINILLLEERVQRVGGRVVQAYINVVRYNSHQAELKSQSNICLLFSPVPTEEFSSKQNSVSRQRLIHIYDPLGRGKVKQAARCWVEAAENELL